MVGLGQEEVAWGGGGNCLKYLKRGWNRKEGRGNKDFKKRGKLGQGVGALKRGGGAGTPRRTMTGYWLNSEKDKLMESSEMFRILYAEISSLLVFNVFDISFEHSKQRHF